MIINDTINDYISTSYTSSTAQGGGWSFKIGNIIYLHINKAFNSTSSFWYSLIIPLYLSYRYLHI